MKRIIILLFVFYVSSLVYARVHEDVAYVIKPDDGHKVVISKEDDECIRHKIISLVKEEVALEGGRSYYRKIDSLYICKTNNRIRSQTSFSFC